MATIENVNDRTILQQFHELYKKQNETETNVENLNTKIEQETSDRQSADLTINTEIQALKDQIDSLGVLFTYKGEVATVQNLPVTNNKPGDVYYVDSEQSEYIWIEKNSVYQWEQFGPAIDLSEYAKQEDLQQLKNEVDAMNTQVENNSSNIVSLTNTKQNKLTAGTNITIDENNVISASGGSGEKLYRHTIAFYSYRICVDIITKSSATFTLSTLNEYLATNGKITASGIFKETNTDSFSIVTNISYSAIGIKWTGVSLSFTTSNSNVVVTTSNTSGNVTQFYSDTVQEI